MDCPTFPVNQRFFPLCRGPGRLLSRSDKSLHIWDTHGEFGNVFVNLPSSSSSLYPGGFNFLDL